MKFLKAGNSRLNTEWISRFDDDGKEIKVWVGSQGDPHSLTGEEAYLFRRQFLEPDFVTERCSIDNGCDEIRSQIIRAVDRAIKNFGSCYPDREIFKCEPRGGSVFISGQNQGASFVFQKPTGQVPCVVATSSRGKIDKYVCVARDKGKPPRLYFEDNGYPEILPEELVRKILEPMMFGD